MKLGLLFNKNILQTVDKFICSCYKCFLLLTSCLLINSNNKFTKRIYQTSKSFQFVHGQHGHGPQMLQHLRELIVPLRHCSMAKILVSAENKGKYKFIIIFVTKHHKVVFILFRYISSLYLFSPKSNQMRRFFFVLACKFRIDEEKRDCSQLNKSNLCHNIHNVRLCFVRTIRLLA